MFRLASYLFATAVALGMVYVAVTPAAMFWFLSLPTTVTVGGSLLLVLTALATRHLLKPADPANALPTSRLGQRKM